MSLYLEQRVVTLPQGPRHGRQSQQQRPKRLQCLAVAPAETAKLSRRDALGLLSSTPLWFASRDAAAAASPSGRKNLRSVNR